MRDNDLIRLFLPIITNGLIAAGFNGVVTKQANQPTQQGIPTAPTVFFYKIGDKRYGFLRREDTEGVPSMIHTEVQQYETTFQISTLVLQRPETPYAYTASDLANECAAIMQSDVARQTLLTQDVGILRVTDVRNPYFLDDRDQFEANPSFDFILTHKQTRVSTNPMVESYDYVIKSV